MAAALAHVLAFSVGGVPIGPALFGLVVALLALVIVFFLWMGARRDVSRSTSVQDSTVALVRDAAQLAQQLMVKGPPHSNAEDDVRAHTQPVLESVQKMTGANGVALEWVQGDQLTTLAATGAFAAGAGKSQMLRGSIDEDVVRTNKEARIDDVRLSTNAGAAAMRALNASSVLLLPLPYGDRTLGVLRVGATQPNHFQNLHADALRPIATLLALHLWRAGESGTAASLRSDYEKLEAKHREAETRLEQAVGAIQEAFILTNGDRSKVLLANRAYETIWGRSLDSLYASPRSWLDAIHPDDQKAALPDLTGPPPKGSRDTEFRINAADKKVRALQARTTTLRDARGGIVGVATVARDVTSDAGLAEELAATKRRFDAAFETSPIIVYEASPGGNYGLTYVSPNVETHLGYAPSDVLDDPNFWTAHLHPDDQTRVFAAFPQLFEKGRLVHEYRFRHLDGTYRILRDEMRLVRDEGGHPLEIVGFWQDITERRRLEEGTSYSLNRIKELQDSRTNLLNTIAHDLASPLTPINLQLHLLETKLDAKDAASHKSIQILTRNTAHLQRLIEDLKDLARLEGGKLKLNPEAVDLSGLVKGAIESFQEEAEDRKIHLKTKIAGKANVEADPQRITQVVFNFLTNALKFTPAEGTITVEVRVEAKNASVRVTDTGRGLSADEIARLFKPFSQVHDPKEVKEKGTGLGLYICKGLIESHGGKVFVESAGRGSGSTFGFSVPLKG